MKTTDVRNYYAALQEQFRLQSSILTDVLPHSGERGRNNEERFREFLGRVLPKKYSIGTGFVVCSEPSVPVSSQTDIVLFDEFHNSPLHRELASHVYPVEIVYATIEVKGRLEKRDLEKTFRDIGKLRSLGQHRYYVKYGAVAKSEASPEKRVVGQAEIRSQVPPRAFLFAYEQTGWQSLADLAEDLRAAHSEHPAHIHGLAVLDSDWYVTQEAFAENAPQYQCAEGNALLIITSLTA
jgi:hypothetical protein